METLANLESFIRSANCGSFSAAARQLGVTPAAASRNVAMLERNLRVRLFQRGSRSLALTEDGNDFLRDAERILTSLDALNQRFRPSPVTGIVRESLDHLFFR